MGENAFHCRAVYGIFPANSVGDDLEVYKDDDRKEALYRFHFLRQQKKKRKGADYLCLSDFVAPKDSGKEDFLGAFAVTTGFEVGRYAKKFESEGDDYSAIMVKALGDRFAEALTEKVHGEVRRLWGFGRKENLDYQDLIDEKYRGIRPAAGYPACPDHTEKSVLWELLEVDRNTGIQLTESFVMNPPSSVSGLIFAHPGSRYFSVGPISREQLADYASRKEISLEEAEKWLASNLGY